MNCLTIIGSIVLIFSLHSLCNGYVLEFVEGNDLKESRVKRNAPYENTIYGLTEKKQQFIIDFHNQRRRTIKTSNMQKLLFNQALAEMAVAVGETCNITHWMPSNWANQPFVNGYMGQNLYAINSYKFNLTKAVNAWWIEKKYYNYNRNTCTKGKKCNHYTQFTWGDSYLIGCAYQFCPKLYDARGRLNGKNYHYLVCNYGPAGNIIGAKPYTDIDAACTDCSQHQYWCDTEGARGLCRRDISGAGRNLPTDVVCAADCKNGAQPDCNCECQCRKGFQGNRCESDDDCANRHYRCGWGYKEWLCRNPNYQVQMRKLCPATCGMCNWVDNPVACPSIRLVNTTSNAGKGSEVTRSGDILNAFITNSTGDAFLFDSQPKTATTPDLPSNAESSVSVFKLLEFLLVISVSVLNCHWKYLNCE